MRIWGYLVLTFGFAWVGLINAFPVLGLGHGMNMGLLGGYLFLGWFYMVQWESKK